ncbi:MAG: hypothetical protein ACPIOQ_36850 [Promethearchaeia archaeon]
MESGVRGRGEFAGVMAASLQEEGRRKDAPGVNAVLSSVFPFVDTWTLAFSAHEVMVACVQRERAESVVTSNGDRRRKTSSCYYCAQCMSCVLASLCACACVLASLCACGNHHSPGVTDMAARSLVAEEHTGTTHTHT